MRFTKTDQATFINTLENRWNVPRRRAEQEWIWIHQENEPTKIISERLNTGKPLAYILGQWEFYGERLYVSESVLIPRPETEQLINVIFEREKQEPKLVIDVGTGSGAILAALRTHWKSAQMIGTDVSNKALHIAKTTVRAQWIQTDLISSVCVKPETIVVANLPYIPNKRNIPDQVRNFEPHLALYSGPRGTEHIERLQALLQKQRTKVVAAYIEFDPQTELDTSFWEKISDVDGTFRFARSRVF